MNNREIRTVCFIQGSAGFAGAERKLLEIIAGLRPLGVRVRVLVFGTGEYIAILRQKEIETVEGGIGPRLSNPLSWGRCIRTIQRATMDADVVHALGEKMAFLTGLALRRPYVRHYHDRPKRNRRSRLLHLASRATARSLVYSVVPSTSMKEAFAEIGVDARVIPNPLSLSSVVCEEIPRSSLRIEGDAVVVAFVGRLARWKGGETVVRAFETLARESKQDVILLIVGGTSFGAEEKYGAYLQNLALELGVEKKTIFTGHVSNALDYMKASDIIVHASIDPEPFGMVILEGLALGKAVVGSAIGGPLDIIQDGVSGRLVRPQDVQALASVLIELASDRESRARLGASGREVVARNYAPDFIVKYWLELYALVVERAKAETE